MASSVVEEDSPPSGRSPGHAAPETQRPMPKSLGEALRAVGMTLDRPGSETPSEEDYEENIRPTLTEPSTVRHRYRYARRGRSQKETHSPSPSFVESESPLKRRDSGVHIVSDEDKSLQQILKTSPQWPQEPSSPNVRRRKFADLVFTRQFSAFDRHNPLASNSPFHGFYTLFWLAVALFVLKISVRNWQVYGNPLGTSDIMRTMFHRDGMYLLLLSVEVNETNRVKVIVLLVSDGIMCALTAVTWLIQRLVFANYLDWDGAGWVIQNVGHSRLLNCPDSELSNCLLDLANHLSGRSHRLDSIA